MSGLFAVGLIPLALAGLADFAGGRFMRSGPPPPWPDRRPGLTAALA